MQKLAAKEVNNDTCNQDILFLCVELTMNFRSFYASSETGPSTVES